MLALAAVPSASVALVVTWSATHGLRNGVAVALGIVLGDLVFVALAIFGLSVLAETMGTFFALVRYAGGDYLIWLGGLAAEEAGSDRPFDGGSKVRAAHRFGIGIRSHFGRR